MQEAIVEQQQPDQEAVTETTETEPVASLEEDQPEEQPAESATADLEAELTETRATLDQQDTEMEALRHQLASATAHYREALSASAPEVPAELVTGATPEEVEASLAQAKGMVERIRSHIEAQLAEQRVPTGAPIRSAQDLSALSPTEKIAHGLARQERP